MDQTIDFESLDFFTDPSLVEDPYPYYERLRERSPVLRERHHGVVMVTGYDEAAAVYRDPETFSSCNSVSGPFPGFPVPLAGEDVGALIERYRDRLPMSDQLPTLDPPVHAKHRALLMKLLTPNRLKENEEFMWQLADRQIAEVLEQGACELVRGYAKPFAMLVIADLLGVPEEDRAEFRSQLGADRPGRSIGSTTTEAMAHNPLDFLYRRFGDYVEERRRHPRDDVLTRLATATFPDGSTPDVIDVVRVAANLFAAGQETTVRLLAAALQLIGERPDLERLLRGDRERIPNFVEEVLRFEDPDQGGLPARAGVDDPGWRRRRRRHDADAAERRREPGSAPLREPRRVPRRAPQRPSAPRLRARHPRLSGRVARARRGPHQHRAPARSHERHPDRGVGARPEGRAPLSIRADLHPARSPGAPPRVRPRSVAGAEGAGSFGQSRRGHRRGADPGRERRHGPVSRARLEPLPKERWDDAVRAALRQGFPEAAPRFLASGPDAVPVPNVLGTLLHHPLLAGPFLAYSRVLLQSPALGHRLRELIVLRVAWRTRSIYEWAQHVRIAASLMTAEEIGAIARADAAGAWTPLERDLLAATDQLIDRHRIEDATWAGLARAARRPSARRGRVHGGHLHLPRDGVQQLRARARSRARDPGRNPAPRALKSASVGRKQIVSMTQPVDREVRQDVADLLVRYAAGIDGRDWKLLRSCFTDDCIADYGDVGRWKSGDEITDWMRKTHEPLGHTLHRITNQAVAREGDTVTARSYVDALVLAPDNLRGVQAAGTYDDVLVRTDGGWKIVRRRYTMVRMQVLGPPARSDRSEGRSS